MEKDRYKPLRPLRALRSENETIDPDSVYPQCSQWPQWLDFFSDYLIPLGGELFSIASRASSGRTRFIVHLETDGEVRARSRMPSSLMEEIRVQAAKRAQQRPRKPVPKAERLENTRLAILQSALEHFARDGFEGASVRKIAAQASVNHGMIRHIYGTKDELWRQAITFLFERIDTLVNVDAEAASGMSDRELFQTYVRRYVQYCAAHPEHARIMIQQSSRSGRQLEWAAKRFVRTRHHVMQASMKRLRQKGELPDVDPISLAFCLAGSCQMYFVLAPEVKALIGRDVFSPEEVARHAETVIKLFLRN